MGPNESGVYDQFGHVLGEYDLSGNLLEETVWLGDIPVATLQPDGSGGIDIYYIHADHLNTPRAITHPADNAIVWQWDSDPFGYTAPNENPSGLGSFIYNLRFPGQILALNGARTYDPIYGMYDQSDPIGLAGGSFSTYSYVGENPLSRTDPFGRQAEEEEIPSFIHPIAPPPESFLQQLEEYELEREIWEEQGQNVIEQMLDSLGNPTAVQLHRDGGKCYKDEPTTPPPPQCIGTYEQCNPEKVLP